MKLARIRSVLFLALLALGAAPVSAATSQYQILLNTDVNPNSGCDVSTVDGTFGGVEHILLTTVETTGPASANVTRIERQVCVTPATDTFGPPILVDDTDRPVGIGNGIDGFNVVETYFPGSILAGNKPPVIRIGVTSSNGGGAQDAMLTARPNTGQPIQLVLAAILDIPTVSEWGLIFLGLLLAAAAVAMLRRRTAAAVLLVLALLGAAGAAWAIVSDLNGQTITEWTPADLLAEDAVADAPVSVDLRALFGAFDQTNNRLVFRLDVSLEFTTAPNAVDDAYTTVQGTVLNVPAPGVLANDTGTAPTVTPQVAVATAQGGTVTVNADGSFSYTPPSGFVSPPTDSFTYTATNAAGSDTATVTITVTDLNEAPSFTKGPDQTVLEDAGPQTVDPWATAISPGPASESGQTVTFNVTGNTNPGLFSAGPAVSPTGALTYTPAANANGTATITITLQDNGGTAGGGVDTSPAQTFVINVTAVNDVPVFTVGPNQTVTEDSGAHTVDPWATGISPGPADESGQTVAFNVTNNTNSALFSVPPAVSPTGALTYTVAADTTGTATITLTLSDNGGTANGGVDTSAGQDFTITVSGVNDAPSFTKGPDQTVLEDAGAQTVNPWATAISAGAGEGGQTLTFNVTGNTNPGLFSAGPAVSPTGVLTYTPAANANGTATITLTLSDDGGTAGGGVDTSPAQTFVINVTAVNDAPSFTKGPDQTVGEDAGPQTVNPWATAISAGPADESSQTLTFNVTGNTNPSLFTVAPSVSPTGVLTYTPAPNTSGTATITLTLSDDGGTANGGVDTSAPQTFVINVNDVNDAPSFTKGADQTVLEDAGPQTVNPWATAISAGAGEGGQTLTFNVTGNTNPALFSAGPAVSPTGVLTYTPAANANGTATITLTLSDDGGTANGGVDTSAPQTFVINVTPVNDVPSFTKGADQSVLEDAGPQTVNPWATAISAGPADESGQTLAFNVTGNTNPGLFSAGPAVSSTGVLTYTPAANTSGTATITLTLSDNGGTANGGVDTSAGQTFVITVADINDAPSFTKGPDVTVNEDSGPHTSNPWATAISAGPGETQTLSFNVTGNTNPGLFSAGPAVSSTGVLTFTPTADAFGTATITLTLSDDGGTANGGVDTSAAQTFVITVNSVNDVPSFTKGADQTVLEDAGPQTVNPWATAISAGPANESGQTLNFNLSNTNPGLFSAGPAVSSTGVLTYTPTANTAGTATITLTISDNGGTANGGVDTSASQTFVITVTGINDAPSFVKGPDVTVDEDSGPQTVNPWATAISPGPPDEAGQTVGFNVSSDNPSLFSSGPSVSPTGVLTFTSAPNAFGTATVTISLTDNGGTANGGVDTSASQTFVITVNPINDPPVADNDPFDFIGNTELRVDLGAVTTPHTPETTGTGFGVLDGDSDPVENDPIFAAGIVGCADVTAPFVCPIAGVGTVTMESNGRFSFVPEPGDAGASESFQYTLSDGQATVNATVTLTRFERVWYVENDATAGGLGRSHDPFDTLAEAQTASSPNDYIFVYFGDGTTGDQSSGIALKNGQHLIGEYAGLSIPVNLNANGSPTVLLAQPGATACAGGPCRPLLDDTVVDATEGVSAIDAVPAEIVGLNLAGNVNGINWTTNAAFAGTGTLSVRDNVVRSATAEGVDVNLAGTGATALAFHDNNLTSTGTALDIQETGTGALTMTRFDDNVVSGNTGGSGLIVNNAIFDATPGGAINTVDGGTTVIGASGNGVGGAGMALTNVQGDLHFTGNLNIFADAGAGLTTSGTGAGFQFRVNSGGAPTGIIQAGGGPAVDSTATALDLRLTTLQSTNSASAGVSLTNVTGTFSAESGSTITNATGTDFNISGGTANVTYRGTITDDVGQLVNVSGATGGTKSFEGAITDGDDGDGSGISLTSNGGATINFSGGVTLSTSANAAFTATGGGTVNVTGSTNTLTTTTATALNVANTNIGASDLTFRRISSNGGANSGIVLNTTGAAGGLTVTGTGGAGTGGTIQNKTVDGISLNNTRDVSLTSMIIDNNDGSGILGDDVTNFSLINSSVTNNADTATGVEAGLRFNELLGNCAITNSTISGSSEDNIRITPASGVLNNLAISGSTIGANSPTTGGHGVSLIGTGTAQATLNVTNTTFEDNRSTAVLANITNTGNFTVNVGTSTFRDNGVAVTLQTSSSADLTFNITNNTEILRSISNAIQLVAGSDSTPASQIRGTISGNIVGNGTADSGSRDMFGIALDLRGDQDAIIAVNSNNVRNSDFEGIWVSSADFGSLAGPSARLDLTLRDNTVGAPDDNSGFPVGLIRGVLVDGRHTTTVCLDNFSNTSSGIGGGEHFRVRQRDTSIFYVERLTDGDGTPGELLNNVATIEAHIAGENDPGSTADATLVSGFTEASNGFCRKP